MSVKYIDSSGNEILVAGLNKVSISAMIGANSSTDGTSGLVPKPIQGDENKYLKGDGTWQTINSYSTPSYDSSNEKLTLGITIS